MRSGYILVVEYIDSILKPIDILKMNCKAILNISGKKECQQNLLWSLI